MSGEPESGITTPCDAARGLGKGSCQQRVMVAETHRVNFPE
jgi:hypothetical protein